MEAGRETDALVAEKVMGFEVRPYHDSFMGTSPHIWKNGEFAGMLPNYSTNIADAWRVVESIRNGDCSFILADQSKTKNDWEAMFIDDSGNRHHATSDTAPLAICLCALNSIGIEA